jgi:hypothetical protein
MKLIDNSDRRFGSSASYWLIRTHRGDLLATGHEVSTMYDRAEKNGEDFPPLSWWRRAIVRLAGWVA